VIILTARGAESDRVRGLQLGADDYVVKPFSVRELLARVQAVIRRSPQRPRPPRKVRFAGGEADLELRTIRYDNKREPAELSEREAELLGYLAANAGRPVTRDEILHNVWLISASGIETRTIDMHVARLREKLGDDAAQPRVLQTIRGRGYLFLSREGTRS
ncbi:MAG: response regulator transcription factor, partial [Phycisphaerae bacterium]|nr:response regulator transcription factor [Phycisphaerae bacterium]